MMLRNDEVFRHLVKGENEKFAINKSFCLRTDVVNTAFCILILHFKIIQSSAIGGN